MKKYVSFSSISIFLMLILSFVIATYAYQSIDEPTVASHWNASGEVDGYMSKFWGLFLVPFMMVAIYLLFVIIPKIDPLKKNIEEFRTYYDGFILVFITYMFYVFMITILYNLGYRFDMTLMIMLAVGILFMILGYFMKKIKRNWFIGIRTPWTLSNDVVWNKTHKVASRLFIYEGIFIIATPFLPYSFWILICSLVLVIIGLLVYSYYEYTKQERE